MITVEHVREWIYQNDKESALTYFMALDAFRLNGLEVDEVVLSMLKSYLKRYVHECFLSGEFTSPKYQGFEYEFLKIFSNYHTDDFDKTCFMERFRSNSEEYLDKMSVCDRGMCLSFKDLPFIDDPYAKVNLYFYSFDDLMGLETKSYKKDDTMPDEMIFYRPGRRVIRKPKEKYISSKQRYLYASVFRGAAFLIGQEDYFDHVLTPSRMLVCTDSYDER